MNKTDLIFFFKGISQILKDKLKRYDVANSKTLKTKKIPDLNSTWNMN